jgi:phosphatidylserine/phosphatidylglycerophosphate/cardiolipin synthase-like enzyme
MLVGGPAAADLAAHAAERWAEATGEPAPPVGGARARWPEDLPADFTGIPAGIARTVPEVAHEVAALNQDALAAARHCIYLEAQYLTSEAVGDALVRQLERPDGPEIVVVVTRKSHGMLEQFAMGNNRDRLLRRLAGADRGNRLRVYYPTVFDGDARVEVKIHAKLVVIDDRLLRIGSSNLNNRSLAVDTECDLALEAVTAEQRAGIRALRNRLIAEQLHQPAAAVAAAFQETPSLIAVIERLNGAGYLQPLAVSPDDGPSEPMPGTAVLDPEATPTVGRLWCELGLGALAPLPQLGAGKQQAADGERHQVIEDPERDQRPDRVDARQQHHDHRLQHAEPARHVGDEGGEIAQDIGHGDDLEVDRGRGRQDGIERAGHAQVIEQTQPDLARRDRR